MSEVFTGGKAASWSLLMLTVVADGERSIDTA